MTSILTDHDVAALRRHSRHAQRHPFQPCGSSLPSNGTLDAIRAHLLREAERGPMEAGMAARGDRNGARPGGATVQCATGRDRAHRRQFARLGLGLRGVRHGPSLAARRPHPGGPARMGRQSRLHAADRRARGRARGNHSVRPGRLRRSRGAARHAGRTRAPDRADLAARQRRPDQSRRRDRRGGARTRHRLFRGRGPGRRPIAHRRGTGRLRRAGRRRTQRCAARAAPACCTCGAISCPG